MRLKTFEEFNINEELFFSRRKKNHQLLDNIWSLISDYELSDEGDIQPLIDIFGLVSFGMTEEEAKSFSPEVLTKMVYDIQDKLDNGYNPEDIKIDKETGNVFIKELSETE